MTQTPLRRPLRSASARWSGLSRRLTALVVFGVVLVMAAPLQAAETGSISGTVSNTASGNLLEGAKVAVPALGLTALTDETGLFNLTNVPAGAHELVVSYIGLDAARATVTVEGGRRAVRNFDLTSGVYQLQEFRVTGEREGGAAAITLQRNAENVKNIVAMDSYGNLPNMNAGEVAIRLPGVVGSFGDENLVDGFTVRGIGSGLNTITLDGSPLTSQGAYGRSTNINNLTGTMFDQMELVKGHTPDKGADSLGGTINLKSRSPLSMREKRRLSYSASVRWAPPFLEQVPLREAHRAHPLFNVQWQELFGVLGGERNLGVSMNLFYSENAVGGFRTVRDFQNTTGSPAYVWDYRTWDNYNNRKQLSLNLKTDYRLSANTKLSLNTVLNDANETFRRQYETRAYTGNQNTVPGAATGVVPGQYTDKITVVRPVAAAIIEQTTTGPGNFYNRMRRFDLGAEQTFGRLQLDYNAVYTQTNINGGSGGRGGILINRLTGSGWILDRTDNDLHPRFLPNGGPDFTNPDNYRPTQYTNTNLQNNNTRKELRGNARFEVPASFPLHFKAGASWREQYADNASVSRRWNFAGTAALPSDPTIVSYDYVKTGRRMPYWEPMQFFWDRQPRNPSLWREDQYYHYQNNYTANRAVTEWVTAGYGMAQARLGRASLLAGVRTERTEMEAWGYVRNRFGSTTAQQTADPQGSADRDYANALRKSRGDYTKSFPSAHLAYDLTANLKARLSWSTSFGRPALNNATPNETVNEANQTLTINNPNLRPQYADNWDAVLEYYFEPVGNVSVSWFHKEIRDYIVTGTNVGTVPTGTDNGFNGEYPGFTLLSSANAGTAVVQGWEFVYQQQFTFLPGLWKGLGASANYTLIETRGNFGGTTNRSTNEVPGFIPRTGNASLSWRYRKFSTRVLYNYVGAYITSYNATSPGYNNYRYKYQTVTAGVAWQHRPTLQFTIDVGNVFNEPQRLYRGFADRMSTTILNGTTITFGVNGRF
ncbi:MAG: TonB-dependent receptor [Verrucomicrobia bacterium]|nr:TonB-dependent receptor [Verrucomicrobiota bacterium]